MLAAIIFFVCPIAFVIAFIMYYSRLCEARKMNKENPGTFSDEEMKKKKMKVTIIGAIAGFFVIILIGLLTLMFGAVAFM